MAYDLGAAAGSVVEGLCFCRACRELLMSNVVPYLLVIRVLLQSLERNYSGRSRYMLA